MDAGVEEQAGRLKTGLSAAAIATTLWRMRQRRSVSKARDEKPRSDAALPALGQRDSKALSLALDEQAPPAEVEQRILRRILQAVNLKSASPPLE
jgi:hypothetical protein